MADGGLQDELAELSQHLGGMMPRRRLGNRYSFFGEESLPFGAAMEVIGDLSHLDAMERALRDTYRAKPSIPSRGRRSRRPSVRTRLARSTASTG